MKQEVHDRYKSGIYVIRNTVNGKVYIGKSKNIYNRIGQHVRDLDRKSKKSENQHFVNAWHFYGKNSFVYSVLEYVNVSFLSERELYWMDFFKSYEKSSGYNLRRDSSGKVLTHESTRKKISDRLRSEWAQGKRSLHSEKLSSNWKNNPERKKTQSNIMSATLTKYVYEIYTLSEILIERCNYSKLKELKLSNVIATFHKKKTNVTKFKEFIIKRMTIEDIVRHS